jgi:hypothetical protein
VKKPSGKTSDFYILDKFWKGSSVQQPEVWVCSLSEQLGGISYYTLMQKASVFSIYQLLSIMLQWTSECSHLGCSEIHCFWFITRIVTFGSSGSSMFSSWKNLQALFQNCCMKIYCYELFPKVPFLQYMSSQTKFILKLFLEGWGKRED